MIKRIAVAFEAGRDGFWLARWFRARDIEVYVLHSGRGSRPNTQWESASIRCN